MVKTRLECRRELHSKMHLLTNTSSNRFCCGGSKLNYPFPGKLRGYLKIRRSMNEYWGMERGAAEKGWGGGVMFFE